MTNIQDVDGLQVTQDLDFQRREWRVQRVGWLVMAITLLAALAGLLGSGPLSNQAQASLDGQLRLEFQKFLHFREPTVLQVYVEPDAIENNELRLSINQKYLSRMEIRRFIPEPDEEHAGSREHTFHFRTGQLKEPIWIAIHLEPDAFGSVDGVLRIGDSTEVQFGQFIYP